MRLFFSFCVIAIVLPSSVYAFCTDSTRTDSVANTASSDSIRTDSTRVCMVQYLGASSTMTTSHRTLGVPTEFAAPYGNAPLASIGVNTLWIGDLLFKTNKLRSSFNIEKFINVYPSPRILENFRGSMQLGYYVFEQEATRKGLKTYPFLGFSSSIYYIDNGVRLGVFSVDGGAGADWFIPQTPLLVGIQASYNHSWNLLAAKEVSNNIGGLAVRAYISIFIREKFNYWGWD